MIRKSIICWICLPWLITFNDTMSSFAQSINGPTVVAYGEVADYDYFIDVNMTSPTWVVNGGTILNQSHPGLNHYLQVQWTVPGTGYVYIYDGGAQHDMLQVTVNCPKVLTPSTSFSYSYVCGSTTITRNSNPPSNVTWYWQTSPDGTETGLGSSNSFVIYSPGTYYLRAKYNDLNCWSPSSQATASVTVNYNPVINTLNGGGSYCSGGSGVTISLDFSQTGINYQLRHNGANDGTPIEGNGGLINWDRTAAGTYTAVATNPSTGCSSTMNGSPTISINPLPTIYSVGGGGSYCSGGSGVSVSLSGSEYGI